MHSTQEPEMATTTPISSQSPARLYALQLRVRPLQSGTLMPFSGELVHGAFLLWLKTSAPEIADALHEGQKQRLFTCSSLHFNQPEYALRKAERENSHLPLEPKQTYTLRITLLQSELFPLLHHALTGVSMPELGSDATPFLQLGKQLFLLEELIIADDPSQSWTGFTSLSALIEQARATSGTRAKTLTLEFASLTAFSRGSKLASYGANTLILPLPWYVFQNLARRWQDIAPPDLVGLVQREALEQYLQEDGVIIVDYNLRPHRLHFTTHQQPGFLGTCTYELRGPTSSTTTDGALTLVQQIHLLARLAFYCGIGYKTSMGLGQARMRT